MRVTNTLILRRWISSSPAILLQLGGKKASTHGSPPKSTEAITLRTAACKRKTDYSGWKRDGVCMSALRLLRGTAGQGRGRIGKLKIGGASACSVATQVKSPCKPRGQGHIGDAGTMTVMNMQRDAQAVLPAIYAARSSTRYRFLILGKILAGNKSAMRLQSRHLAHLT